MYDVIVQNPANNATPNPSCCSNPKALCQRCAEQAGLLPGLPQPLTNEERTSNVLPLPSTLPEQKQERKPVHNFDGEHLPLPSTL